jgi:hypothetical protein
MFRLRFVSVFVLLGCSSSSTPDLCGADGHYDEVMGAQLCAYSQAIVIEGGFRCPSALPYRIDLEGAAICSDRMLGRDDLPDELCRRIDRTCGRPDAGLVLDGGATDGGAPTCPSSIEEGTACELEGQSCGGPCTDVCSFCNVAVCEGGVWTRLEVFPAPCFDCGEALRCQQDVEYCEVFTGGAAPGFVSYDCVPAPAACEGEASCACIDVPGGAGACNDSGDGVVVQIATP